VPHGALQIVHYSRSPDSKLSPLFYGALLIGLSLSCQSIFNKIGGLFVCDCAVALTNHRDPHFFARFSYCQKSPSQGMYAHFAFFEPIKAKVNEIRVNIIHCRKLSFKLI
jgi:hypothetical protein